MQVRFDQLQPVEQNSEDESTVYYFSVLFIDLGCYKVGSVYLYVPATCNYTGKTVLLKYLKI